MTDRTGRGEPRSRGHAASWGVAILSLALLLSTRAAAQDAEISEQVCSNLHGTRAAERAAFSSPAFDLGRLGDEAMPALFAAIATRRCVAEGCGRALSDGEDEALRDAFGWRDGPVVSAFLGKVSAGGRPARLAVLRILARVGTRDYLPLAVLAAEEGDTVLEELEDTVASILQRDEDAYSMCEGLVRQTSFDVRILFIQALGATGSRGAATTLARLLGYEPILDAMLLAQLGRVAHRNPSLVPEEAREQVRTRLDDGAPQVAREAAVAVGKLVDQPSVEALVRGLRHDHRGVRQSCYWALGKVTGLGYRDDARVWESWLRREQAWRREEAPRVFEALRDRDARIVVRALGVLVERRFRTDEIAANVEPLLSHGNVTVRLRACAVLGRLGCRSSVEPLIDVLEHDSEAVARAARTALQAITGKDLAADPLAWRAVLREGS